MKRQQDIERILEEFKGVRNIPGIKTAKKRVLITKKKNEKGECVTSRKGIADAFGEFYKRLYEDRERDDSEHEISDDKRIPEITTEELQSAISKLKTGKSPDSNGIRAEDIKACDDETREMMRQLFNEIIKRNNFTPDEWKKVKIKVIHKKGDVENVSNYRPICSLPTLYKLFSTILYGRLYPVLDQKQAEDQAGFRKTYQTTDHLATYRLIEQKCQEWGIKMWTATVDFMKAFDSISHKSIWDALIKSCNIDHEYISLLRKIYREPEGFSTDRRRERNFRHPKRIQARRSDVQPAVQHGTSVLIKGRNTTMAKEKRNGNLLERPRPRLPHELAICRRRDAVRNLQRTAAEYDVRLQESNRESGTQDPPRQDEDSQQPEHHEFEHKKTYQSR